MLYLSSYMVVMQSNLPTYEEASTINRNIVLQRYTENSMDLVGKKQGSLNQNDNKTKRPKRVR